MTQCGRKRISEIGLRKEALTFTSSENFAQHRAVPEVSGEDAVFHEVAMAQQDRDRDVFHLLIPRASADKDENGHDIVPPTPLAFDRVNEGRAPKSNAPLFKLPLEVLGTISNYVPREASAAFAFVNRDCRQLARSRQFTSILLDFSDASAGMVKKLLQEGIERRDNSNKLTLNPSLGACIRRITIATNPGWLAHRHGLPYGILKKLGRTETRERVESAGRAFFGHYLPSIEVALRDALPHLELLDWEDKISMPPSMFTALACSPVKHLKLFRATANEDFEVKLPLTVPPREWPLRALHLELRRKIPGPDLGGTSRLCASILQLCAPTLESLVWISPAEEHPESHSFGLKRPSFPVLRDLELGRFTLTDSSVLDALIGAPGDRCHLRTLAIDTEVNEVYSQFFEKRGAIPSLETFVWDCTSAPDDQSLDFLQTNSQLTKLSLSFEASPLFLDTRLLPLLSRSYTRLTSLDLSWTGTSISEVALQLIATLTTLQQLCLSAGHKSGWRHDWAADHASLRNHLSRLPNLTKLALIRDTFQPDCDGIDADSYYEARIFRSRDEEEEAVAHWFASQNTDDVGDVEELQHEAAWEMVHRKRVVAEANEYVREMPRLDWLYFGQTAMCIESNSDPGRGRVAVPLFEKRDDCCTLLTRMFGRESVLR